MHKKNGAELQVERCEEKYSKEITLATRYYKFAISYRLANQFNVSLIKVPVSDRDGG